jgi:hypothetical protein
MQQLRRCGRAVAGIVLPTEGCSVVHVGAVCAALEASHDGVIGQLQRLLVVAALRPILARKQLLCVYRFRRHRKPCGSWYAQHGGGGIEKGSPGTEEGSGRGGRDTPPVRVTHVHVRDGVVARPARCNPPGAQICGLIVLAGAQSSDVSCVPPGAQSNGMCAPRSTIQRYLS